MAIEPNKERKVCAMRIKITGEDILQVVNARSNNAIEALFDERAMWLSRIDLNVVEQSGHDPAMLFDGIVGCDEEWTCFMNAASSYIQNKEYGYTTLIKQLRKDGYKVSRIGKVSPQV